jgi:universal stress protein A
MDILPFNRILCPTDFSEASKEALKTAKDLAVHFSSELILLHAVHPLAAMAHVNPAQFNVPWYQKELEGYARKRLGDLAKEDIAQKVVIRQKVVVGDVADAIVNSAREEKVDLIVIATHGDKGWKGFMLGSVTEKVVRPSPCSVLVIPKGTAKGQNQ